MPHVISMRYAFRQTTCVMWALLALRSFFECNILCTTNHLCICSDVTFSGGLKRHVMRGSLRNKEKSTGIDESPYQVGRSVLRGPPTAMRAALISQSTFTIHLRSASFHDVCEVSLTLNDCESGADVTLRRATHADSWYTGDSA